MEKDCCIVYKSAFHLYKNIQDRYTYVYLTFTYKPNILQQKHRERRFTGKQENNKTKCLHK